MVTNEVNDSNIASTVQEREDAMEKGYAALAADPEFRKEQQHRKLVRGLVRRNRMNTEK